MNHRQKPSSLIAVVKYHKINKPTLALYFTLDENILKVQVVSISLLAVM